MPVTPAVPGRHRPADHGRRGSQLPGFAGRWPAGAQSADDVLRPLLDDAAEPLMQAPAHDTTAGLVAFVVPGDDAYSRAQGVTADAHGGVEAKGPEFLMHALDRFLPVPDTYAQGWPPRWSPGRRPLPCGSPTSSPPGSPS